MAISPGRLVARMLLPGLAKIWQGPTAIVDDLTATLKFLGLKGYSRQIMFNDANHYLDVFQTKEVVKSIPSNKWVPKEYQVRSWDMAPNRKYLVHGKAEYEFEGFEGLSTQWVSFYTDEELEDEEYLQMLQAEFDRKALYTDKRNYVSFSRIGSIERNAKIA